MPAQRLESVTPQVVQASPLKIMLNATSLILIALCSGRALGRKAADSRHIVAI